MALCVMCLRKSGACKYAARVSERVDETGTVLDEYRVADRNFLGRVKFRCQFKTIDYEIVQLAPVH